MLLNCKNLLPQSFRFSLFRSQLDLPTIKESGLTFKPAETAEEFQAAFEILHECYVEFEYMKPNKAGLRVTPYHLLPNTVTLIVKKNNEVIGTVSIVRDNPLGLPMDKIFDLSHLRQSPGVIGEISALAIRKQFRGKKGQVLHLLMRYLWKFTQEYLNLETFVCAVNPAMNEMWESIYLFKSLKALNRIDKYDFVNDAPAIGLVVPVHGSFPIWQAQYQQTSANKDLYNFMKKPFHKNEYHFSNPYYSVYRNPMNKEICDNFLTHPLVNPLEQLSLEDRIKTFCQINSEKAFELDFFNRSINLKSRDKRYDVFCRLSSKNGALIPDVSETGLKLAANDWIKDKAPDFLSIQIGPNQISRVKTQLQWQNSTGVTGHKIIDADRSWLNFISYLKKDFQFEANIKSA
jgi:hypothetical protein